jgi:hypothetical protein
MHARLPLWVIRVGPKQAEASPDARFAPKADKQADVSASLFCARTGREQMQHRVQVYSITSSASARSQAKHSGGLGADDQLEFARLGDRQVDWNPLAICGACSAS